MADEHGSLGEAGEFAEDIRRVAAMGMQGFLANLVDGGGIAEWAGGTEQGIEGIDLATGYEFHRPKVDHFVLRGREAGGFDIEDDDGAVGECLEQGVEGIAVLVGAELGEIGDFETTLLAFEPEGAEGGRTDAGRRALGEPLKRAAVRWIQEQAEAGQQVFDFLPPEEIELLDGEMVDP